MREKLFKNGLHSDSSLSDGLNSNVAAYFVLAAIILLSYGYEIFNFNLTIDEETHTIFGGRVHRDWISQGRWGMALLNYLLLQNPITPVVSVFLGVAGTAVGLFVYLNDTYKISRLGILSIAALAITTPTLSFVYTFSTLAYGVGFAFFALAVSNSLIFRRDWGSLLIACLLAAFAISVYQTFVFVLAMFVVVHAVHNRAESRSAAFVLYKRLTVYFLGGVLAYLLVNYFALKAASMDTKYVGQFIDIKGLFQHPFQRIMASAGRVEDILRLRSRLFGIHSFWLSAVIFVSVVFSFVYPLLKKQYGKLLHAGAISISILMIMVLADAIAPGGAPLRSVIYIPVGIAIIVASAFAVIGQRGRGVLIAISCFAIIGNSMINNHLFASSVSAEFKDRMLAESIIDEVRKLSSGKDKNEVLKIEVLGNHAWPATGIQSKSETFGASFFEWDAGNRRRIAAYLSMNGQAAVGASEEERVRVYEQAKAMPAWPDDGSIAFVGDVLVLKFGDYSVPQRATLCAQGVTELCN